MRLKDTVIIVTGSARNIGRVYALGLAREGAKVVVADIRDPEPTAQEIRGQGGEALALRVDVTSRQATEEMARRTVERFGRIDGLINNAALFHDLVLKPFYQVEEEEWDRLMSINVKGLFLCAKAVFPQMKAQASGRIINIASNTVFKGTTGFIHYVTSKGAVIGFTRALAREVGEYGINVNAVAPDYIPHEKDDRERPEWDLMIQASRCIKRREVPQDVLGTIIFLCSSDSDFITGQTILVNGGSVHY